MRLPLAVVGPAYADATRPVSVQEAINYYVEIVEVEGGRTKFALKGTPGLTTFSDIGSESMRGMHVSAEVLYAVSGTTLYSIASDGTETSLGTVAGTTRVGMADNRIGGGNQVVVVNGAQGYVYNTATSTFAQITDGDFRAADVCDFLDQYIILNVSGTAQFQYSALADATSYDALDFATKESGTEDLVTLIVSHGLIYLFGSRRSEIWQHTRNANLPFERINGATFDLGCAGKHARTRLNDSVYFLGADAKAYRIVGYNPVRISTHAIEQAFADETLSACEVFAQSDRGHDFVYFRFPSGKCWVYDLAGGFWHRRKSHDMTGWRANCYAYCYGKHLVGDYALGRVGELDSDAFDEYGNPLVAERITATSHDNQKALFENEVELVFDTGFGSALTEPTVDYRYSDDGGYTYTDFRQAGLGLVGQYGKRVRFHRLGRYRNRVRHIRVSDAVRRDLLAATVDVVGER